jgi:RNA polymerase sigma-70 factor, ECF subfamily
MISASPALLTRRATPDELFVVSVEGRGGRLDNRIDMTGATALDAAMERYADGDEAAFGEVYDALAPRLLRFLSRQTGNVGLAEDLLQETFLNMCSARASFFRGARVTPWAFTIARRLLIDASRKSKRQVPIARDADMESDPPPSRAPRGDQMVEAREVAERVEAELARMPGPQREAFMLVKVDGLSILEAAEVLEISPNAAKLRAFRAYDALRASLGDMLDKEWLQ